MKAVYIREVRSYFTGLTGAVFAAFLLLFAGIFTMIYNLNAGYANFEYAMGNMPFVFLVIVPILTMRTFAAEKRAHTDNLLYSLPVSMTKVVMGKYYALLTVFVLPVLVICLYPLVLSFFGEVYLPAAYGSIVAFLFLGAALLAAGMFISSLTESQAVAAGVCFAVLLVNFFLADLAENLASYGLDTPAAIATVQYVYTETDDDGEETEYEASFTLELGDYCDGGVYARMADSDMVYIVDATILDNLLDITPEIDMLPTEPVRLTLSDVTGFDVTIDGETYSVSISRETVYDDEGNESEEVTYTLSDGTELDSDTVTGLLEDLNSMSGDGKGTERSGEELVSFTFYQEREGYETVTLSFDEYNSTDCITTLNGETGILAPLDTVNSVIEGLLEAFTAEDEESSEETAE